MQAGDQCAAVRRAVGFLVAQYDPAVQLLRESPITAPDKHWIATDNRLALAALRTAVPCAPDAKRLAAQVERGLAVYGSLRHGLIEAVTEDAAITWPPRTAYQAEIVAGVWHEERLTGAPMVDWREYADLAFYGVMVLAQSGQSDEAHALYRDVLATFDDVGFVDKANGNGQAYATYKLALALLAASALSESPDAVLTALLDHQAPSGGFYALYETEDVNDPNVETTAYSILALMGLREMR